MKKLLVIALVLVAILSLGSMLAFSIFNGKNLKGSGKLVTHTMAAPDFSEIDASRAVKVIITQATDKITITADDNLIDWVVVKVDGDELQIGMDKSVQNISNSDVTVLVPANGHIRSLDASSASQISSAVLLSSPEFSMSASSAAKIKAAVKSNKCEIDASSAANIEAAVKANTCEIEASSASKIELSGTIAIASADLSSASKLNAEKCVVDTWQVDTSSAAKASVNCTKLLNADASSGSAIFYTGSCQTSISKSSGGNVSRD
ncbi:MAG: DUF2807 domain-containing protein [Alistipes sp.]